MSLVWQNKRTVVDVKVLYGEYAEKQLLNQMTQSVHYHKIIPSHIAPICKCISFPTLNISLFLYIHLKSLLLTYRCHAIMLAKMFSLWNVLLADMVGFEAYKLTHYH